LLPTVTAIAVEGTTAGTVIDFDRSLIGREFEAAAPIEVTAEMIANFRIAIGYAAAHGINPTDITSSDELVAPPAFAGVFRLAELTFEKLPNSSRRLAAGMEVDFVAPIRAGDRIMMASRITEVYEKTGRTGAMVFMVIGSTLKNQNGEIVARIDHRFMHRP
jgi:acyl-coenzyme A thioesterase PaaI-like protein